ncbi:hypothetical protein C0991_002452 [Blastosporella zonata]|nr:hypothetical protein C0991_002452 [Blastosporella zonata]
MATKTKALTSTRKPKAKDRRLEELESLHQRTSVISNLQISPGHRLKLDSPSKLIRKRKPIPEFKIEYTELKDPFAVEKTDYDLAELDDDNDDDLPSAPGISSEHQIQTPSSDNNYSNSDIDALIRAVPLDDKISATVHPENETRNTTFLASSPAGRKRKRVGSTSTKKRVRIEEITPNPSLSQGTMEFESPQKGYFENKLGGLFPPDFSDAIEDNPFEPNKAYGRADDDDYLFSASEYLDLRLATPDLTLSASISDSFDHSDIALQTERNHMPTIDNKDDEVAELDAWLNSGAVEII